MGDRCFGFGFKILWVGLVLLTMIGVNCSPVQAMPIDTVSRSIVSEPMLALSSLPSVTPDSNFVTKTIAKEGEAIVQINVSRSLGGNVPDFLQPFFGGPPSSSGRVLRGIGSGFVISPDGKILTNAHVVNNADTVNVAFADGRFMEGKVLGKDPVTDIAVIQVQGDSLPTVTLGDSEQIQQGQWAIAIGNPLGLQETVTVGVISATQRFGAEIGVPDKRIGFIQTDAAINPGNSGGPLFNEKGEVIGINSAVIGGTQGLGFAIPINTAQKVAQQLITTGKVEHPYIGVQMVALTPQVFQQLNGRMPIEADRGVLMMSVARRSPAAQAGIQQGDVVQKINGQSINRADQVQRFIEETGVGGKLQIELQRSGRTVAVTVQPQQLPNQA